MSETEEPTVPSIPELRVICQGRKLADRRAWYRIYRVVSIYLTWVLLHTNVSANQVSAASLISLLIGLTLATLQSPWVALAGYGLVLVYFMLDKVDGEVARFRRVFSLRGVYLDELGHNWSFPGIFIAATIRVAPGSDWPMLVGCLGGAAALMMVLIRISKGAPYLLFGRYVVNNPALLAMVRRTSSVLDREAMHAERFGEAGECAAPSASQRLAAFLRDQLLFLSTYTIGMWALIAATIAELITGHRQFIVWVLICEGVLQVLTYAALLVVNLNTNLGNECLRLRDDARRWLCSESGSAEPEPQGGVRDPSERSDDE